jgi:uncharacterized membrane protein YtjA (UPF0391 family)
MLFLMTALVSAALGFGIVGGEDWMAGKVLFFVFGVLFLVSLIGGGRRGIA